jgi:hypothetical protein
MNHYLKVPNDLREWVQRQEEKLDRDPFDAWLIDQLYDDDPENQVMEVTGTAREWAQQQSGNADPSDFLLKILRAEMESRAGQ